MVQRIAGFVLRPAVDDARVLRTANHQRLGGTRGAHRVDHLLHPRRRKAHPRTRASVENASPGRGGVLIAVWIGFIEQVEENRVIVFEGGGDRGPEGIGVIAIRHRNLPIGNGGARRAEMQIGDGDDAVGIESIDIIHHRVDVVGAGILWVDAVDAEPAVLIKRDAHRVDRPGQHVPDGRIVVRRTIPDPPSLGAGIFRARSIDAA